MIHERGILKRKLSLTRAANPQRPMMWAARRRRRKKTGAGVSLFARLNNTTTILTLMKILLYFTLASGSVNFRTKIIYNILVKPKS